MNIGKIVAGIGFILSYASMMMFESMQTGGSFLKGGELGSYLIALAALSVGIICITVGLARSYEVNK